VRDDKRPAPRIIGLAGTNGSGKDTVGQILAGQHGYLFVSVTEILRDELRRRGLEVTRENLRDLSAEWRRESGQLGMLVDKVVEIYKKSPDKFNGVAIASIRNPGEADRVHELGGTMIWVDADPKIRYGRVQANAASRQRKGEDNKTFEQFLAEEQAEMNKPAGGDDATLNMSAVKAKCDVFIDNDGTDLADLQAKISEQIHP
jgi:dephospho-CoA kinase